MRTKNKLFILYTVFWLVFLGLWGLNFAKLMGCDFKKPYVCEIAHGAGVLLPPLVYNVVWFGTDTVTPDT